MSFFSRFFKKKKPVVFGKNIQPDCKYCLNNYAKDYQSKKRCPAKCESASSCKAYIYDPVKREPNMRPLLRTYSKKDFEL